MRRLFLFRILFVIGCLLVAAQALAQQESKLGAEFRLEGDRLKEHCNGLAPKALTSCLMTVATDHPVHLAIGSIAPKNGFGFGAAFVTHHTPSENWRLSWNADAVGAPSGAWRAGGYLTIVRTAVPPITVVRNPAGAKPTSGPVIRPYPVIGVYGQIISLPALRYYGLGPDTPREGQSAFEMRQTVVGANVMWPLGVFRGLNLSLLGGVNGRFVRIRGAEVDDIPSIEERHDESSAPGLTSQPGVVEFNEGIRIAPSLFAGHLQLGYRLQLQQFISASDSTYSFRRWTADLAHEVPLYRTSRPPLTRDTNGPNECAIDPATDKCPSVTRDRTGTIGFRLFASKSGVSKTSAVPFYFQQTIGGSDVNGNRVLASYDDYRFRGPHVLVLQQSLEHSIYGPVGLWLAAEQGKVARQDGRIDFTGLRRSFAVGVTLRAGGFPAVVVSWATGGTEGHHIAATISTTLLGGSSRPSLH